jgi:hypothetical protein
MENSGITIHGENNGRRIEMKCEHKNGLIYIVPSESNWVCSTEFMPAHALAGLFSDLSSLEEQKIYTIMQKWGIYYRSLETEGNTTEITNPS